MIKSQRRVPNHSGCVLVENSSFCSYKKRFQVKKSFFDQITIFTSLQFIDFFTVYFCIEFFINVVKDYIKIRKINAT